MIEKKKEEKWYNELLLLMEKQLGPEIVELRVVKVYGIVRHVQFSGHGLENRLARYQFGKSGEKQRGTKNWKLLF